MPSPFITIGVSNGTDSVDLSLIVTATVGNTQVSFGDNDNFMSGGKVYQLPAIASDINVDIKEAVAVHDWHGVFSQTWSDASSWTGNNMSFSTSGAVRNVTAHGPTYS